MTSETNKPHDYNIDKLNEIFNKSETIDQETFADMRSSLLLVSGDHYNRRNSRYWNRIRDSRNISPEQKLRLTKNHIQKITKGYVNNIVTYAPSVNILPKNEKENQDQKAAALNQAVWQDLRHRQKLRQKTIRWAKDFVELGESYVKVFWDETAGDFLGWEPQVGEDGDVLKNADGEILPSQRAVFSGDIVLEQIHPFNIFRHYNAKTLEDSICLGIKKIMDRDELEARVGPDQEKLRMVQEDTDKPFIVFDGSKSGYSSTENQVLVLEYYFRPCMKFPKGYYFITTKHGILWEGELPGGMFPLQFCGWDEVQTHPRHQSIVKTLRPYQAEINRTASKIAEHHVTLGDDKLLIQSGTKLAQGGTLPGVRGVSYTGMKPEILPGRSGDQYMTHMTSQIEEMYKVANYYEDQEEKSSNADAYAMLYKSLRNKKKFSIYAEKFEHFLMDICMCSLETAKFYYDESRIVPAIGRHEYINIQEFKSTDKLSYQIKLEPMVDDIETMMGKQLSITQVLQYAGGQLEKEDIGKLVRNMPFGNLDESFGDFTIDYDTSINIILALDRGEQVQPNPYDNHTYIMKRLTHRMRQSDFSILDPMIQQNYQMALQAYEQIETEQQQQIQAAQSGFIPSGGAMVKVDYYVPKKDNPEKSERAVIPAEAMDWLIKRLEQQGSSQERLGDVSQGAVADISKMYIDQLGEGQPEQDLINGQARPPQLGVY